MHGTTVKITEILMLFLRGNPAYRLVSLSPPSVWFKWVMNHTHEAKFSRL